MRHQFLRYLRLASVAALAACAGDSAVTGPRFTNPDRAFWRLGVNYQAITLSMVPPYDTIRLVATPQNAAGASIVDSAGDSVTTVFLPVDPGDQSFTVSAEGLLRAQKPVGRTAILVRTTVGPVTRTVLVPIAVTAMAPPPTPSRLVLQVTPTDEMQASGSFDPYGGTRTLVAQVADADGNVLPDVPVVFRSSDTLSVVIDPYGQVTRAASVKALGRVMLYATTTVYGQTLTDSVPFTLKPPGGLLFINVAFETSRDSLTATGYFLEPVITVSAGTTVVWAYPAEGGTPPIDVVFDDPGAAAPSPFGQVCDPDGHGNIAAFAPDPTKPCGNRYRIRAFPTPGTYTYHSALYGTSGTIVVLPP